MIKKLTSCQTKNGSLFLYHFFIVISFIIALLGSCQSIETNHPKQPKSTPNEVIRPKGVPAMALTVADYIEQNNAAPDGFIGGREFENRESILPSKDASQQAILYHEYDIYPKVKGKNRGAERIILGSDKSRYYTSDHYQSFIKF